MTAFEVYLNGKKLCTAGIEGNGVMSALIGWRAQQPTTLGKGRKRRTSGALSLNLAGLIDRKPESYEYLDWIRSRTLQMGDEVCVKIVTRATSDEPALRRVDDPKLNLRAKKSYVRKVAKELGWKIVTK